MKKRLPFTLLEVLISLILLGTLLFTTFSMMRATTISKKEFEFIREKSHIHHLIHQRLTALFISPKACKATSYKYNERTYASFSLDSKESLMEKNEVDKLYSHFCFVDEKNRLQLHILDEEKVMVEQILLKDVFALKCQFFDPTNAKWLSKWDSDKLPLMVKLTLEQHKESPLTYTFFFPEVYEEQELE